MKKFLSLLLLATISILGSAQNVIGLQKDITLNDGTQGNFIVIESSQVQVEAYSILYKVDLNLYRDSSYFNSGSKPMSWRYEVQFCDPTNIIISMNYSDYLYYKVIADSSFMDAKILLK